MSNNTIYVFVKGRRNKYAYIIVDSHFNEIHRSKCCSVDEDIPIYSDWHAIIASLKFIAANKGRLFPDTPVTKIFTSYEENFEVASRQSKPDKFQEVYSEYLQAKRPLERGLSTVGMKGDDDSVRVLYLPREFKDHMREVISITNAPSTRNRPS